MLERVNNITNHDVIPTGIDGIDINLLDLPTDGRTLRAKSPLEIKTVISIFVFV